MSAARDHGQVREGTPTTYYEDLVKIPGMGDSPNRCLSADPVAACEAGHIVVGRPSCETRYCPDHWRDWNENAIEAPLRRLAAYRQAVSGWEKRLVHVVASPPQDRRYSVREFYETRSDAYDAFEAAGVRGGACVAHGYRTNDTGDELYRTAVESGDIDADYGRWRFIREISDGWEELKQYIEPSPHYHALGPSEDVSGDEAPDGWVVDNLRSLGRFEIADPECYQEMASGLAYIQQHGAVTPDKMMTTYFGEVHPAAFDPVEELTDEELSKIDEMVAQVVGSESSGTGPDECPHDDCEHAVFDLKYLDDRLDDDEWVERVRDHTDGGRRLAILRGTRAWTKGLTDTPPPSARSSAEQLKTWLKKQGQIAAGTSNRQPETVQDTFDTSVVWSLG